VSHTWQRWPPDHHHDVRCGDCGEPLRVTCAGLAARYTAEACDERNARHACVECATKPRCEECGEVLDSLTCRRCRDAATESGIAREEGGEG